MARATIEVNMDALIAAKEKLEENGPLPTQSKLFEEISKMISTTTKPVSAAVVRLRILEHNVPMKTVPARDFSKKTERAKAKAPEVVQARGVKPKVGGTQIAKKVPKIPGRMVIDGFANEIELRNTVPVEYQGLVDEMAKGSMPAILKINCLSCCGWEKDTVNTCHLKNCVFWAIRPKI